MRFPCVENLAENEHDGRDAGLRIVFGDLGPKYMRNGFVILTPEGGAVSITSMCCRTIHRPRWAAYSMYAMPNFQFIVSSPNLGRDLPHVWTLLVSSDHFDNKLFARTALWVNLRSFSTILAI